MVYGVTQNGWPRSSAIAKYRVPGTSRDLWLNKEAAPLLLYVARRFDAEVDRIDTPGLDDWGFARSGPIPGSGTYSNHESGTAIDLNATAYPWKVDRMNASDEATCRRIVAACNGTIRWGGDYNSTLDQMHFEIDASRSAVRAQITRMGLNPNGTVKGQTVASASYQEDSMFVLRTKDGSGVHYLCANGRATALPRGYVNDSPTVTVPGDGSAILKALSIERY